MNKKRIITLIFSFFFIFSIFIPLVPITPLINNKSQEGVTQDGSDPIEKIIDDDLDFTTQNSSTISQGTALGTGNPQTLTLTCKMNQTLTNYNSTDDFNVSTGDWNITQTYLNFTDIFGENVQVTIEDSYGNGSKDCEALRHSTSFEIHEDTDLLGFSAYVYDYGSDTEGLRIRLYNASWSGTRPEPNTEYFYSEYISAADIPDSEGWQNINIPDVYLNTSETDNNTFYIEMYGSAGEKIYWYYESDAINGDQTNTYVYSGGWFLATNGDDEIDLAIKVNLSDYSPYPSEIKMQVNGTDVSNSTVSGEGDITLSGTYVGSSINFNVTANSFINFTVNWTCIFENQTMITPTFDVSSGSNTEWNLTFAGNFLADSYDREMNTSIGSDWSSTRVFNNSVEYSDISIDNLNDYVFIDNITTLTGNWLVNSSQANYGDSIYLFQYGSLTNITMNRLVNMSDTIFINATLIGATSGEANLTIFDPIGTIIVNKSNNNTISENLITFGDVILPNVATTNGTYNIQVLWWNGSATSLMQTDLEIINRTQLDLLSDAEISGQHFVGDFINVSVYLNDTSKGSGSPCGDADITIEVFNMTDQSICDIFTSNDVSEGLLGAGYYNYSINTTNYLNGTYKIRVNSTKPGAVNNTLNTSVFSLIFDTSLSLDNFAGTDLGTTYYNQSIYLKFSYNKTAPNVWVQNPDVLTIQVDGYTPVNLNTNGSYECYDISLSSKDYIFQNHSIQVILQKFGYFNWSRNYTWKTENATARIQNLLVNELSSPVNVTGIVYSNYPNNLTISFEYTNDTAIDNAMANVSINGAYLRDVSYYPGSETYNFTLNFTDINYNPTYPNTIAPVIMINISKYGYTPAWFIFTWNYSRATTDLSYNGTIASLYTYPTNLTLALNYSVSSLYSNEEVEYGNVKVYINDTDYMVPWDPISELYNITLNNTEFFNRTETWNITITADKNGFENQTIQFWWNITEINAIYKLDTPIISGYDLGTTYWNKSLFLKFYYNTTSPNQYIPNPDIAKLWVGSIEHDLTYNDTTDSYDIMLNTSPDDYGFIQHDIMVNFSKYGYNNYSQNYTWTVQIANTSFDVLDILGTSYLSLNNSIISTFYPNNITIGLRYINDTFIDGATVTARVEGPETPYSFTFDPNTGIYNLTLNYTNLGYVDYENLQLDINITASKYGYDPVFYNFTWNFTEAKTDFTLISPTGLETPGNIITPFGQNLTIKFNYSVYEPFIANISVANVTVRVCTSNDLVGYNNPLGYYYLWYNDTSDIWQIQLNTTDYYLDLFYLFIEANRTGYEDFVHSSTNDFEGYWTINKSSAVVIIPTLNATSLGGNQYWHWYDQLPLNLTFIYNRTTGENGITGATRNITIRENGTSTVIFYYGNSSTTELGAGYYQLLLNDSLVANKWYEIEIFANYSTTIPIEEYVYLFVNETQTTLTSNNTILNHLIWGDTLTFNVTYNDTTWNQLLTGAMLTNNWTEGGVDWSDTSDGNYTITIPLNDTNLIAINHAGLWSIQITATLENRTMGVVVINFNITGRTNLTLFNNSFEDNAIIGQVILQNISTYRNENATLFMYYNSTDFASVNLTSASISHNWSLSIIQALIGTNGTYMIKFNTTGLETGLYIVGINISQQNYILQNFTIQIRIWTKHVANITFITNIPSAMTGGADFTLVVRVFDETLNEPVNKGIITFTIAGKNYTVTVNATGYATLTFSVPASDFQIFVSYLGDFSLNATTKTSSIITITRGFDIWFIVMIVIIVLAVSVGGTITAVVVRQRRKHAIEKTKARKAKVIASVTDVANIKHVTVIHKGMGIDIFSYAIEKGIDPTLLSGFLQAVREFGKEFSKEKEE